MASAAIFLLCFFFLSISVWYFQFLKNLGKKRRNRNFCIWEKYVLLPFIFVLDCPQDTVLLLLLCKFQWAVYRRSDSVSIKVNKSPPPSSICSPISSTFPCPGLRPSLLATLNPRPNLSRSQALCFSLSSIASRRCELLSEQIKQGLLTVSAVCRAQKVLSNNKPK